MRKIILLLAIPLLCACSEAKETRTYGTLAEMAASNQMHLAMLSPGMSREEVFSVMGQQVANTRDGVVNNPWTIESFLGKDGAQYEILYYVTRKNQLFTPVRATLTTPVVLKDGKVLGWGERALQDVKR
jgi:hypothetical protein